MRKLFVGLVTLLVLVLAFGIAMAAEVPEGAVVDEGQLDAITKVGNHMVGSWKWLVYPTCTKDGIAEFDCIDQSAETTHQHHVVVPADGHNWASEQGIPDWGRVVEPATCTKDGYAIDYCVNWVRNEKGEWGPCGAENPDKKRVIHMEHEYDDEHYVIHKEPTCTATGLGQHVCIFCGAPKNEKESEMIVLPMADHKWTKWNITWSTCDTYGTCTRTCETCDARQILDKDHQTILDHGVALTIQEVNPLYNDGWDYTVEPFKSFDNVAEFEAYISKLANDGLSFKVKKDELWDCHDRAITYTCTACEGKIHDDFTVVVRYPATDAHIWNEKPEKNQDPTVELTEKLIKDQSFNNNGFSLKPSCLLPGFELYFCKYDFDHGTVEDYYRVHPSTNYDGEQNIWKKVILPPTGHDWTDWYKIEEFDSEDPTKTVTRYVHSCKNCGAVENKNEIDDVVVINGLHHDEDGVWRYYENGEFVEKTAIVEFEGAKFWVIKGILAQDATGLTICPDGKAWFLEQGRILEVTRKCMYGTDTFAVKNGALDVTLNGLSDYDTGVFVFAAGKLLNNVNGLWQNPQDSKWYFLSQGQVQNNFSGVAEYSGHFFVIKGGVFDNSYNGTIEYDGHTFNVVDGELYDEVK